MFLTKKRAVSPPPSHQHYKNQHHYRILLKSAHCKHSRPGDTKMHIHGINFFQMPVLLLLSFWLYDNGR